MSEGSAAFSILRIKRKRTTNQLPLDALVIEQPEPSTKRRKATHTPATVPQTSRGIFRFAETVSIDSFDDETKTRQVKDRIQSFLTRPSVVSNFQSSSQNRPLARIPSSASLRQSQSQSSSNTTPSRPSTPTTITKSGRKLPSSAAAALLSSQATSRNSPLSTSQFSTTTTATPPPSSSSSSPLQLQLQRKRTRYRIVTDQTTIPSTIVHPTSELDSTYLRERQLYLNELQEDLEIQRGLRPPRVISQGEILARQERRETFEQKEREREREKVELERSHNNSGKNKVVVGQTRIYDAIAEDDDEEEGEFESGRRNGKKKLRRESSSVKKKVKEEEDANMMENFGDMLKEYLTLQDSTERTHSSSSSTPTSFTLPNSNSIDPSSDEEEEEDDGDDVPKGEESDSGEFVYDVYVRDLREPSTVTTNNGTTNQSDSANETSGGGNGFDVSSLEGLKRIGELAGLEEDEDLLLRADGEGDSESEVEDNADQDSNEENDYRNDYPDEESEDEDRWEQEDDDDNYEGNDSDY
ncbi:hypothetical protein JCM5350_004429 [Sporobolomyces pararoseus]